MKGIITIDGRSAEIELTQEQEKQIDNLMLPVTERIKTFADVLEYHNTSATKFENGCAYLSDDEISYRKMKLIVSALNEGWEPDWDDNDQSKYMIWWDMRSSAGSGLGLSCLVFGYVYSRSIVGSRLCFKTRELAEYAGKNFAAEFYAFMKKK